MTLRYIGITNAKNKKCIYSLTLDEILIEVGNTCSGNFVTV
jgi:hypothetical protein